MWFKIIAIALKQVQWTPHPKQKPKIWTRKNSEWTSANVKRPRTSFKTPLIKVEISQQVASITLTKIWWRLGKNEQITRNENEINCTLMGSKAQIRWG